MATVLLAFYADDFTGSTDALEQLARAGVRTALFIEPPDEKRLAAFPALQAIGVAGMTRAMDADALEATLRPALVALRRLGPRHVHYKVCSTFDSSPRIGSIGRAIDVAAGVFRRPFVPVLAAAPGLGRYAAFGHLFARRGIGADGPVYRIDRHPVMSRHPITPADESDLLVHLARQTEKRIALFDVTQSSLPLPAARDAFDEILAAKPEIVLCDAITPQHVDLIGRLLDEHAGEQPLFSVGSSAIETGLAALWMDAGIVRPAAAWPSPGPAAPLLVAAGSCSHVTGEQIAVAIAHGFAEVAVDAAALLRIPGQDAALVDQLSAAVIRELAAGRSVVVHTSRGPDDPRIGAARAALLSGSTPAAVSPAGILGAALGRIVAAAAARTPVRRVVLAGGDTSSAAARSLGIEALEMIAPLAPGAPLCRVSAPGTASDGLEMCFKGGQVGRPDFFLAAERGTL